MALFHNLLLVSLFIPLCSALNYVGYYCGNAYDDSQTTGNIQQTLAGFVANAESRDLDDFAVSSVGSSRYTIYGLEQCRGDVAGTGNCTTCLLAAAKELPVVCPGKQADARIW